MTQAEKLNFAGSWVRVRNLAQKNPQATRVPESEFLERDFFGEILYFYGPYVTKYFRPALRKNNKK